MTSRKGPQWFLSSIGLVGKESTEFVGRIKTWPCELVKIRLIYHDWLCTFLSCSMQSAQCCLLYKWTTRNNNYLLSFTNILHLYSKRYIYGSKSFNVTVRAILIQQPLSFNILSNWASQHVRPVLSTFCVLAELGKIQKISSSML